MIRLRHLYRHLAVKYLALFLLLVMSSGLRAQDPATPDSAAPPATVMTQTDVSDALVASVTPDTAMSASATEELVIAPSSTVASPTATHTATLAPVSSTAIPTPTPFDGVKFMLKPEDFSNSGLESNTEQSSLALTPTTLTAAELPAESSLNLPLIAAGVMIIGAGAGLMILGLMWSRSGKKPQAASYPPAPPLEQLIGTQKPRNIPLKYTPPSTDTRSR